MTQATVHHEHSENASEFVANDERAHWHDQSLWFVRSKRDKAAATLPVVGLDTVNCLQVRQFWQGWEQTGDFSAWPLAPSKRSKTDSGTATSRTSIAT